MRRSGAGARSLLLGLSVVATLGACSDRTLPADDSAQPSMAEGSRAEPEQVVQRIEATADTLAHLKAASSSRNDTGTSAEGARVSAAESPRVHDDALPAGANHREPITSKRLEAELDRLEAELAN